MPSGSKTEQVLLKVSDTKWGAGLWEEATQQGQNQASPGLRVSTCQMGPRNRNSGWASLAHLGNQAQVLLTLSFMPAIRAQEQSSSALRKAAGIKPPSVVLPASLITAHPSSRGSQQEASQRCCLTAHWHAASGKWREGEGKGPGLGCPGLPDQGDLAPAGQAGRRAQVSRF